MPRNPKLDKAFKDASLWRQEALDLRKILLATGLTEERKWNQPCYTHDGKNICIIQRMKDFLALLFFKGALLTDPDGLLEVQGPNSRAGYRMRFTSKRDVARAAKSIKAYVREAIDIEKAGLKPATGAEPQYPEELNRKLAEDAELRAAFDALTPGRRRGYVLHFADAKQPKTRLARIEKHRRKILNGQGLHDR